MLAPMEKFIAATTIAILLSGSAAISFAQQSSVAERLKRDLRCQAGQNCQPSLNRSLEALSKKRGFKLITETELGELAKAGKLPSSDVEVYFDFGSAAILPLARVTLDDIGKVLTDPEFAKSAFVLVGHTDATDSETYNLDLSEQRAIAVRDYLLRTFAIDPSRLRAYGRGKQMLKVPAEPYAAVNRRVQVINFGMTKETEGS
jgi:outer membrane protein OmpA-like peptidoglycan-associated protein